MTGVINSTADIAKAVALVKEAHSILDVFYQLILAEPTVEPNEHGRIDVVVTLAEAKHRAKRKGTRQGKTKKGAGGFELRKTRPTARNKLKRLQK